MRSALDGERRVKRVAILWVGASGIGLATVPGFEVLDMTVASFDCSGMKGRSGTT